MNMIEKIQIMMDERGLKKAHVAEGAGISYTTLDGLFKKGYQNVRYPTLKKLSVFFDVSMEYLMNDEINDRNYGKCEPIQALSHEEKEIIKAYRNLSRDKQLIVKGMILMGKMECEAQECATDEPVKSA